MTITNPTVDDLAEILRIPAEAEWWRLVNAMHPDYMTPCEKVAFITLLMPIAERVQAQNVQPAKLTLLRKSTRDEVIR
jgi:hypothetical protein